MSRLPLAQSKGDESAMRALRILACIPLHYYESLSITLSYYYVAEVLRRMGHTVHVFEFVEQGRCNREGMNDFFLSCVIGNRYDLVFVETSLDEFDPDVLDEAAKRTVTLAWNSDDDWRWESYSSHWCKHFTYMVTTYRGVYEENKKTHPNLLLSQWACTGFFDGADVPKDLDFTFVGGIYPRRAAFLTRVRKTTSLKVFSRSTLPPATRIGACRRKAARALYGQPVSPVGNRLDYADVNEIWNRSKVSLTPLEASQDGHMQIKGRVFEMGMSGTVMLCSRSAGLEEFYVPGREYLDYATAEECCEKARYLATHEQARLRIARAYRQRTLAEHMWDMRYRQLFSQVGLPL